MERDNLHYNIRNVNGYNKVFNFIISEREAGKSTSAWLDLVYASFKRNGATSLIVKRQIADITEVFIDDIQKIINKFSDEKIKLKYKSSSIKNGIVDITLNGVLFVRLVALSIKLSRLKSLILPNIKYIIFDEFICNRKTGESYLKNESFKFNELYNTFQRECETPLKCYFLGNPYSLYNPYFVEYGINPKDIKRGKLISGNNWVVDCYELKEELKKKILERNPLYQFENDYKKYAFEGQNIEDKNIQLLDSLPQNYSLKFIFRLNDKNIGVYKSNDYLSYNNYYVQEIKEIGKYRNVYCFDFLDLVENSILMSTNDRLLFQKFKVALQRRMVYFQTLECYYLCEEIYLNL